MAALLLILVSGATADDHQVYTNESIQAVINQSNPGDTIYVHQGIYRENLNITKQLTLIGAGANKTAIRAQNTSMNCISIGSDGVKISQFAILGANTSAAGIRLTKANECEITKNLFIGNYAHIRGSNSSWNIINSNVMLTGVYGVYFAYSDENTISNNLFYNITLCAVCVEEHSDENTVSNNVVNKSGYGVHITFSNDSIVTGNNIMRIREYGICTVDECHRNEIHNNMVMNGSYCGIMLARNSSNNVISYNTVRENHSYGGILLAYESNNNTVEDNTVESIDGQAGIVFYDSNRNNTITRNRVSNNSGYGLWIDRGENNTIYDNVFTNRVNVRNYGKNRWNITISEGPNIMGGSYIGGNYWNDYEGNDINGDGFGDDAHELWYDEFDYLPLMNTTLICGDVNGDGQVSLTDVLEAYRRAVDPEYPLYSEWAADVDGNTYVSASDVIEIFRRAVDPTHNLNFCRSYLPKYGGIPNENNNNNDNNNNVLGDICAPSGLNIGRIGSS